MIIRTERKKVVSAEGGSASGVKEAVEKEVEMEKEAELKVALSVKEVSIEFVAPYQLPEVNLVKFKDKANNIFQKLKAFEEYLNLPVVMEGIKDDDERIKWQNEFVVKYQEDFPRYTEAIKENCSSNDKLIGLLEHLEGLREDLVGIDGIDGLMVIIDKVEEMIDDLLRRKDKFKAMYVSKGLKPEIIKLIENISK